MCKKLTFLIGFVLVLSLAGAATGAKLGVILRAFRELLKLRRDILASAE